MAVNKRDEAMRQEAEQQRRTDNERQEEPDHAVGIRDAPVTVFLRDRALKDHDSRDAPKHRDRQPRGDRHRVHAGACGPQEVVTENEVALEQEEP